MNVISVSLALGFVRSKNYFFRFFQGVIFYGKKVALSFICEMKFLVRKGLGYCREHLMLSQRNVYKWYKNFKDGREWVESEKRLGLPSTFTDASHVKQNGDSVLKSCRLIIRELADAVDSSNRSLNNVLKDISSSKRVKSRLIPKFLHWFLENISLKIQSILSHNHHIHLI